VEERKSARVLPQYVEIRQAGTYRRRMVESGRCHTGAVGIICIILQSGAHVFTQRAGHRWYN